MSNEVKPVVRDVPGKKHAFFNCIHCGKEKKIFKSQFPDGPKYCTKKCHSLYVRIGQRVCLWCQQKFKITKNNRDQKYCTKTCANKHRPYKPEQILNQEHALKIIKRVQNDMEFPIKRDINNHIQIICVSATVVFTAINIILCILRR